MSPTRRTRKKATTVDDVDRAIIVALQADGRAPYTRLATAVGLSEAAVRQRVQRLIEQNVMQVVAVTNPTMHGQRRMAMIGVHAEGDTEAIAARRIKPPVRSIASVTGTIFRCARARPHDRAHRPAGHAGERAGRARIRSARA